MPLERGAVIGRYVVLDRVGEGAMGVVYAAYDPDLDRKLALKVIRPDPRFGSITVGGERQRLLREAQAMARVSHPAVVGVYDVGSVGDEVFLAMELVDGLTLERWLAARPRRPGEILDVFLAAGDGLQAAHEAGLVHRDFKPANVLVRTDGRVQVTDFGLAREPLEPAAPGPASTSASDPSRPSPASTVTMAGVVLGTPRYMAPEQRGHDAVDARADQYAFCVALQEALTGELPPGLEPATVPLEPAPLPPRPLAPGQLRRPLRAALERGLRPSPAERFESMGALLAALRRARRRDRRALAAGALLAAALASTSAVWLTRAPPCDEGRRLAGLWDDARRAEISAAFERARGPAGAEAFTFAARALDELAAAWTAGAQDSCQATRAARQSPEVAALRAGCLDQSLAGLAAVTAVLARADAQTVDRAQEAIGTWGGAAHCADVPALLGSEPPALPPAAAAAGAEIRARLAEAKALSGAGKNAEALELARAQVEAARPLDSAALMAEALFHLAQNEDRAGHTEAALATAREAFPLALRSGHRRISVLLTAVIVYYLGNRQSKFEEAHFWARVGHALAGPHAGAEALTLDANVAALYSAQGRYGEGLALYQRVAERRLRTLGERNPSTLNTLSNVALNLQHLGRHEEAMAINQRVLALRVELQGPTHRQVATLLGNLAENQEHLGLTAEAVANHRRALQLRHDVLGPEHRDTAISELMLAAALTGSGRAEEALPLIAHAEASLGKAKGGTSGYTASAKCARGNALGALGRWPEALPHHRACLAEFRTLYGDAHPETTQAMRELGESLLRTGHRDELLGMIDPMLAAEKAASGETGAAYRRALAKAAEQLLAAGALDRAEQALAAAEPLLAAHEPPGSRPRALALVLRAELELARGRTDAAATAARAALAVTHLAERAPHLAARAQAALGRAAAAR